MYTGQTALPSCRLRRYLR